MVQPQGRMDKCTGDEEDSAIDGTFDNVIALLDREVELYGRVLKLCEQEQALLVTGDVDALINILGDLQAVLNTLSQVSFTRISLAERLGVDWNGIVKKGNDMAQEGNVDESLKALSQINQMIARIAGINRANEQAIRNSLEYISFLDNYLDNYREGPELRGVIYAAGESRICDQHSLDWKR